MRYLEKITLLLTLFLGLTVSAQNNSASLTVKSDEEVLTYYFDSYEDLSENLEKILADLEPATEKKKKEKPENYRIEIAVTKTDTKESTTIIKSVSTNQADMENDIANLKKHLISLLVAL